MIGDVFGTRYHVVKELGRGGMGVVLAVDDRKLKERVALKYAAEDAPQSYRRFAREVRVMASIDHPHVMPVLDQGLRNDPPFFTMPLAAQSIADEVGSLSEEQTLDIFYALCLGVQAIHTAGGTHRDIKPLNLLRMEDGTVRVSDLGLVKLDPRDTTTLTQTADFLGTRVYCAPEQLAPGGSRSADRRTDIFQLGKTLYELMTGESPALVDPGRLPTGLSYVVERATRNHPNDRYQSVGELMDAVENYKLSRDPGAHPSRLFQTAIDEAKALATRNQYSHANLNTILSIALKFADEHQILINTVEKIPNQLLSRMAEVLPQELNRLLKQYCIALDAVNYSDYSFAYAELVADKMNAVYRSAVDPNTKALAVHATLSASVQLNRFAAMAVFDEMLTAIEKPEDALAVAEVLRQHRDFYSVVAERVPRSKLHVVLQRVYDELLNR